MLIIDKLLLQPAIVVYPCSPATGVGVKYPQVYVEFCANKQQNFNVHTYAFGLLN